MQRMSNEQIDKTIQQALDSLPEPQRREIDCCVAELAGTIGNMRGGKGFGVKRARELVFALALWMNRKEAA